MLYDSEAVPLSSWMKLRHLERLDARWLWWSLEDNGESNITTVFSFGFVFHDRKKSLIFSRTEWTFPYLVNTAGVDFNDKTCSPHFEHQLETVISDVWIRYSSCLTSRLLTHLQTSSAMKLTSRLILSRNSFRVIVKNNGQRMSLRGIPFSNTWQLDSAFPTRTWNVRRQGNDFIQCSM